MKRYGLFALFVALTLALCTVAFGQMFTERHIPIDGSALRSVTVRGMCDNWKAWKKGADLIVTCPGTERPAGAVELRAYYVVGG